MKSFIIAQVKDLIKKHEDLKKDILQKKVSVNQKGNIIRGLNSFSKQKNKYRAALALSLAIGVGSTIADLAVINKLNTKTYFKTHKEMVLEDEIIPLGFDYYPKFAGNKRIDIIELEPWEESYSDSYLSFSKFAQEYQRDVVLYENVPMMDDVKISDYFDYDVTDLEGAVIDTKYTYNPDTLDEAKRIIIYYLQENDSITVWDNESANAIFYVLLILLPLFFSYIAYKSIKGLYQISKNEKVRNKLLDDLKELELNIVKDNLEITEIESSIIALYNKYSDIITNEKIANYCRSLRKGGSIDN